MCFILNSATPPRRREQKANANANPAISKTSHNHDKSTKLFQTKPQPVEKSMMKVM